MSDQLPRREVILYHLRDRMERGMTIAELRSLYPEDPQSSKHDHHGSWSGVLSLMHRDGTVLRLEEERDGCDIYVLPPYVNGRPTSLQGRPPKDLEMLLAYWLNPAKDGDTYPRARNRERAFVTAILQEWEKYCPPGSNLDHRIKMTFRDGWEPPKVRIG